VIVADGIGPLEYRASTHCIEPVLKKSVRHVNGPRHRRPNSSLIVHVRQVIAAVPDLPAREQLPLNARDPTTRAERAGTNGTGPTR